MVLGGGMRPVTEGSRSSAGAVISRLHPCQLLNIVLCTYVCSKGRGQIRKKVFLKATIKHTELFSHICQID